MSTKSSQSVFDLPSKSIELVKQNWPPFLLVSVVPLASGLAALLKNTPQQSTQNNWFENMYGFNSGLNEQIGAGFAVTFFVIAISLFLYAMQTVLELKSVQNLKPSISELLDDTKKYVLPLLGQAVLMILIVVAGLILFIVPGIIAFGRLALAPYLLVDRNLGVVESLKASNELAKGNQKRIWAAIGVFLGISLMAGIISSIPRIGELIGALLLIVTSLVLPLRYMQIVKSSSKSTAPTTN